MIELTVSRWEACLVHLGEARLGRRFVVENVDRQRQRGVAGTHFQVQSRDPVRHPGNRVYQKGDREDRRLRPSWPRRLQRLPPPPMLAWLGA